ncbi:helix-turn-helix domain-containing protein, partial [bacterium AH-315-O15]|nr:helix-turn-helix domain-containing protein [bacterium AH-315-O15]
GGRYVRLTAAEKHEIIRLVEGSDLSVRRTLRELGVHRSTFYAWYRRYQERGRGRVEPPPVGRPASLEPSPAAGPAPRRGGRAGRSGTVAPRAGVAVHGPGAALSLGVQCVSHPQGRGSHHQSGVCGALGGQDVCSSDAPAHRVVVNRLHLPAGRRVGLVLPVHRARRLLALHRGVDAADVDAGVGRH